MLIVTAENLRDVPVHLRVTDAYILYTYTHAHVPWQQCCCHGSAVGLRFRLCMCSVAIWQQAEHHFLFCSVCLHMSHSPPPIYSVYVCVCVFARAGEWMCVRWGCSHHPNSVLCLCLQRVRSGLHKNRAKIAAERGEEERALLARTQS